MDFKGVRARQVGQADLYGRSKRRTLRVLSESPLNAEPPDVAELLQYPITPRRLIYKRNHSDIKDVKADAGVKEPAFNITIDGEVDRDLSISFQDLVNQFSRKEVVAALQCAGNRRAQMAEKTQRDVKGLKWNEGAVSNVKWGGVLLRDVLLYAGIPTNCDDLHVCLASHIAPCEQDTYYGVSIPIEKVMDEGGDVLLAYEMNDEPLTPEHGFPLRIVVPGFSGARWVKWIDRITVSRNESPNFYQQRDYKVLPDTVISHDMADAQDWWSRVPAIQAIALNSVVATVQRVPSVITNITNVSPYTHGHVTPDVGRIVLRATGYALSGTRITKVDISADSGKNWVPAQITYQEGKWSWSLWEGDIAVSASNTANGINGINGENGHNTENGVATKRVVTVWSRAQDESGDVQVTECAWNLRGVGFCAVGERQVEI
ncbi:hypothetical protein SERLA73DRAFT_160387 [Serpula lacrymans var. lacrymans S7.3]|uniref:Sulfite oxidase n=2 Tax=Serpula lacrymans var. lacrymans TaxID=341189 RepID=F8PXQ8_SERL3|nr:uncharacterized protein SERLADRAFT_415433 [Serpula lacrymans var. lacrymans S7.9]EGN98671.1 hypothetical protein SERLA73DRAFT_160387 [Serpula lacrymans var. lacrymans S7.3]EGO24274.1 hypothetical protein SERLADRAFT_415433 [Serpula lacrymans var. lacrymans S7.9]